MSRHALLRTWNNPRVLEKIAELQGFVNTCTVVVNTGQDNIDTIGVLDSSGKPINVIPLDNYGWSKALNDGVDSILRLYGHDGDLIMPISNEVMINCRQLAELELVALREGSSMGYALFKNPYIPHPKLPRNTLAAWPIETFDGRKFDEQLDTQGGMEDYELVMRIFRETGLLPFAGPRDVILEVRPGLDVEAKRKWESEIVARINQNYHPSLVATLNKHLEKQYNFRNK